MNMASLVIVLATATSAQKVSEYIFSKNTQCESNPYFVERGIDGAPCTGNEQCAASNPDIDALAFGVRKNCLDGFQKPANSALRGEYAYVRSYSGGSNCDGTVDSERYILADKKCRPANRKFVIANCEDGIVEFSLCNDSACSNCTNFAGGPNRCNGKVVWMDCPILDGNSNDSPRTVPTTFVALAMAWAFLLF